MHCLPGISTKCSAVPQEVSTQVGWTSNVSQCYVSTSSCSAYSSLIVGFSPASYISTLCMHSLVFSQKLRCMEQFVCLVSSSLFLFPPNSNQLSLPKLNSLVSSLQNCCALPRYSLVCQNPVTASRQKILSHDHIAQSLKTDYSYVQSSFLVTYSRKASLVPFTLPHQRAESFIIFFDVYKIDLGGEIHTFYT